MGHDGVVAYRVRRGIEAFTKARDRLLKVMGTDAHLDDVLRVCLAAMREITSFDGCTLMTVDPATLLATGGIAEGFHPDSCAPFWDNELLGPGYNKFTDMARSTDPIATLYEATDGDLQRSPMYVNVYAQYGVTDELRIAFKLGSSCWGVAAAVRCGGEEPFPEDEVRQLAPLVPLIAKALKDCMTRVGHAAQGTVAMLVVDDGNRIENLTLESRQVLDELRTGGVNEGGLPGIVHTVVTRARSSRTSSHVATRVHGSSGVWRRVTAIPMEGSTGRVAVMIEPARASDLTPILLESYGLSSCEVEIVTLVARGLSTKELAAELNLSPHTVRDHLKSIFAKTGATSRGELVASLFAQHLLDGFHSSVVRADGSSAA
jgi:DNA-binding CsgD family transcriptional regulator